MDEHRWPEAGRYLRSLPGGLDAFPSCKAKADASLAVLELFPELRSAPGVDSAVLTAIANMTAPDAWVPDVLGVAIRLLAKDFKRFDDAQFLTWNFELSGKVFKRPLYRALMYVMSPSLVLSNAAKRWAVFRQGTVLDSEVSKHAAKLILRAPEKLYPLIIRRGFSESFRSALMAAGAKQVGCEMTEASANETLYRIEWS